MLPYKTIYPGDMRCGQLVGFAIERIGLYDVHRAFRILRNDRWIRDGRLAGYVMDLEDAVTCKVLMNRQFGVSEQGRLLTEHFPRCAQCGGLWPCRDELIDAEARAAAEALNARCVVCGDRWGTRMAEVKTETPDGVAVQRYHTRKGSTCRRAYLKVVANDPIALAELQREDAGWARQ